MSAGASSILLATQQFDAVNPHLVVPNVLAFVNHDHGSDFEDICQVVTGVFRTRSGQCDPIYEDYRMALEARQSGPVRR